ncbi:MAG: hypothetical protein O7F76_02850 [Planctomycetota bacterium]|nr:hypothetical protein [Planctomycetota bacterium]
MNKFDDHRENVSFKCSRACIRRLLTVVGAGLLLLQSAGCETFVEAEIPYGACCLEPGVCMFMAEVSCIRDGGEYQGDDTDCDEDSCLVDDPPGPNPPVDPTGACCNGSADDEGCEETTFNGCDSTFLGNGTTCPLSGNCDEIVGACCDITNGSCTLTNDEGCDLDGQVYQGDGTNCQDDGCEITGACCDG